MRGWGRTFQRSIDAVPATQIKALLRAKTPHTCEEWGEEVNRLMAVVREGKVVGMVSLGDAVKSRLMEIGQILIDSGMEGKKGHGSFTKHLRSKIMPKG
jgi:hypothetical protein